jgi:flagellar biogenesis protein FliO
MGDYKFRRAKYFLWSLIFVSVPALSQVNEQPYAPDIDQLKPAASDDKLPSKDAVKPVLTKRNDAPLLVSVKKEPPAAELQNAAAAAKADPKQTVAGAETADAAPATLKAAAKPSAAEGPSGERPLFTLGPIDGESDAKSSVLTIRFDKKLDYGSATIEDHSGFIQIPLPYTIIPEPGKYLDLKGPYFSKVSTFQINPQTGAVRVFLHKPFSEIREAANIDVLGDRIVLMIDHKKLEQNAASEQVAKEDRSKKELEEVIARTEVKNDIKDPAAMIKKDETVPAAEPQAAGGLSYKVKMVAVISAILFGLLILISTFKSLSMKLKSGYKTDDALVMKTIASHSLAPKHKLTLVQVGPERILLGVSPDGIQYLTTIKDGDKGYLPSESGFTLEPPQRRAIPVPRHKVISEAPPSASRPAKNSHYQRGGRINSVVGDDGIKDLGVQGDDFEHQKPAASANKAIEDVTSLIRRKIKNMPSI